MGKKGKSSKLRNIYYHWCKLTQPINGAPEEPITSKDCFSSQPKIRPEPDKMIFLDPKTDSNMTKLFRIYISGYTKNTDLRIFISIAVYPNFFNFHQKLS